LILLSQQGDQQALEEVLERHRGIVKGIAAGFVVSAEEREDLLQEGMIGLWKAVQAYRKGGGANFAALARVCVRRRMISALRKMRIYVELPPQDERLRLPWVVRETLLSTMSALERKVFDRYLAGDSYAEVAVDLKIPPKMVDNALQRAKKKAQRRLGVEERVRRGAERLGRHSTGR
jgi:RNA polymerase sporulation-specific sigma factor